MGLRDGAALSLFVLPPGGELDVIYCFVFVGDCSNCAYNIEETHYTICTLKLSNEDDGFRKAL